MPRDPRFASTCTALLLAGAASSAAAGEPLHEPFRVMTYNVRQVNDDDTGAYTWKNRSPGVIEVIADNDPDIFGVQESSSKIIQDGSSRPTAAPRPSSSAAIASSGSSCRLRHQQ